MHLNFYQPPCALLNPQVFATVKAFISRLWTELKQSEVYKEYLFWLHNAGKALPATTGWLFGFSPNELDAFRFVIENGLYYANSSWAVAWVNENRPKLAELRLEINGGFTRQQLAVFSSRTCTKSIGYHLHCAKRFVTNKLTEGASMLAAQGMRVQTPEIIEKWAADMEITVSEAKAYMAKYRERCPEEDDLTLLYNIQHNRQWREHGKAIIPAWQVIHREASNILKDGKPLGVTQAVQEFYDWLTTGFRNRVGR